MTKYTLAGLSSSFNSAVTGYHARAKAIKDAFPAQRKAILDDATRSQSWKNEKLQELADATRKALTDIREEQDAYVRNLKVNVEKSLLGNQPTDANSVLLRRDAADRARRVKDEREALDVLQDAIRTGDESMADALGYRARGQAWISVLDAYQQGRPDAAETAGALAFVEGMEREAAYNLTNSIAYSMPHDASIFSD
jgi:hypothetical protein